jgi:hypothetical protein
MLERALLDGRYEFNHILAKNHIRHILSVKLHKFKGYEENWISHYRPMSQFSRETIFWVSVNFKKLMKKYDRERPLALSDLITESLLHEYAYVIIEWAVQGDPVLMRMIMQGYEDVEEFANDMVETLKGDNFIWNTHEILNRYISVRFEG